MSTSGARLCIRPPVRDEKSNLQKHVITLFARATLGDIPSILDFPILDHWILDGSVIGLLCQL
jgi:hypothetical protein